MSSSKSQALENLKPEDVGLSPLDYRAQARSGADPLREFNAVQRECIRALGEGGGRPVEVVAALSDHSQSWVRDNLERLREEGVVERRSATIVHTARQVYSLSEEFRESELWSAAQLYEEVAGDA